MLRRIRIKSLEDIALGLIQRDNETKKDYYIWKPMVVLSDIYTRSIYMHLKKPKQPFRVVLASFMRTDGIIVCTVGLKRELAAFFQRHMRWEGIP